MTAGFDVTPLLDKEEGQHFERESLFEGEPGKKRHPRTVSDELGESAAVPANAQRGVLILAIEDGVRFTRRDLAPGDETPSERSPTSDRGENVPDRGENTSDRGENSVRSVEPCGGLGRKLDL